MSHLLNRVCLNIHAISSINYNSERALNGIIFYKYPVQFHLKLSNRDRNSCINTLIRQVRNKLLHFRTVRDLNIYIHKEIAREYTIGAPMARIKSVTGRDMYIRSMDGIFYDFCSIAFD